MAGVLSAGRADGELAPWVDPVALATQLFSAYVANTLRWAAGELTDAQMSATVRYSLAIMLLGVARGAAVRKLERLARANQPLTKGA
jgi:hypothetical protein